MNITNLVPNSNSPLLSSNFATEPKSEDQTILLVEDDSALRRYLQIILERAGFNVVTARDGMDAMSKISTCLVDVVVSDAIMPRMDGYELCNFVRKHERLTQTPFILLSGLEQDEEDNCDKEFIERADVYLSKPVSPDDLVSHIGRLLPTAA